jgi:PAS domain S-box-containing protein
MVGLLDPAILVKAFSHAPVGVGVTDADGRFLAVNVTERREAQRRLARAEQMFQLAFDCAPIGIAVVDVDGRLQQVNRALQSMLGYEQVELVGASIASVFHPGERRRALDVIDRLLSGEPDVDESVRRLRHRDGHTIQARCILATARDPDGAFGHLLMQVEDLRRAERSPDRLDGLQLRDRVTGLPTEQVMAAHLALTWGIPRSLLLIDMGDRPSTKDSMSSGRERVVGQLAQMFARSCREGDLLARVSEHEFAVVVEDDDARSAQTVGERVAEAMSHVLAGAQETTQPAIRVGIARDQAGTKPLSELLQLARAATGGSATGPAPRAIIAATSTPLSRVLALETDLMSALRHGEISLVYQPIVDLSDGSLHSAEALSRWRHPVLGDIGPAEFVPIAERSSAILELLHRHGCPFAQGYLLGRPLTPHEIESNGFAGAQRP